MPELLSGREIRTETRQFIEIPDVPKTARFLLTVTNISEFLTDYMDPKRMTKFKVAFYLKEIVQRLARINNANPDFKCGNLDTSKEVPESQRTSVSTMARIFVSELAKKSQG